MVPCLRRTTDEQKVLKQLESLAPNYDLGQKTVPRLRRKTDEQKVLKQLESLVPNPDLGQKMVPRLRRKIDIILPTNWTAT